MNVRFIAFTFSLIESVTKRLSFPVPVIRGIPTEDPYRSGAGDEVGPIGPSRP